MQKYDLYSPAFKANTYRTYATIRQQDPIMYHEGLVGGRLWFFTRHEDVEAILRDHKRFVKDFRNTLTPEELAAQPPVPELFNLINQHMLNLDQPDHTRLRNLVSKAFTPQRIQQLRGRVQTIADDLLDKVQNQGNMDLIGEYAFPLPIIVIAELLGVPSEDRDLFRRWSNAFVMPSITEEQQQHFLTEMMEFVAYLRQMFGERRLNPRDDLITALLQAEDTGDKLSETELFSMVILLLVAGHETTVNLIGNGILALLQHPKQLEKLKNDPFLIETAVEELLRYDSPVERALTRFAAEDVQWGEHLIRRKQAVIAIIGSANRDELLFEQPDDLDITRSDNPHVAFGKGIHYCLGAPLARMEGAIAILTLLRRLPNLHLAVPAEQLEWRLNPFLRGLGKLPIRWG